MPLASIPGNGTSCATVAGLIECLNTTARSVRIARSDKRPAAYMRGQYAAFRQVLLAMDPELESVYPEFPWPSLFGDV